MYIFKGLVEELFLQVCTVCEHVCLCLYCSENEPLSVFVWVCMRVCMFVHACVVCVCPHASVCVYAFVHVSLCVCPCTCVCDDEAVGEAMFPLPYGFSFLCVQGPSLPPTPLPLSHHRITTVYQGMRVWEFSLFTFSFSFSRILIFVKKYRLEMRGIALRAFSFS